MQMEVPGFVSSGQATLGSLFAPFSVYFYFAFVYFVCTRGGGWQAHATVSVHTWGQVASTRHCQCAHVEVGCRHTPQSMGMHIWGQVAGTRHCQCAHVEVRTQLLGADSLLSPNGSQRLNSGNLVWAVSTFNL